MSLGTTMLSTMAWMFNSIFVMQVSSFRPYIFFPDFCGMEFCIKESCIASSPKILYGHPQHDSDLEQYPMSWTCSCFLSTSTTLSVSLALIPIPSSLTALSANICMSSISNFQSRIFRMWILLLVFSYKHLCVDTFGRLHWLDVIHFGRHDDFHLHAVRELFYVFHHRKWNFSIVHRL